MKKEDNLTFLFLSESYKDIYCEYKKSIENQENYKVWDYVVLTASNEIQAKSYTEQINKRKSLGLLPSNSKYLVIPDRDNKRIGNGGSTLEVIKHVAELEKTKTFKDLKILIIHSGGDSKRIPQYSSLGKVFSPVPRELPNGQASTLFDELFMTSLSLGCRIKEGLFCLSGDTLLICNPLQISFGGHDAGVIGFKEDVDIATHHGVFVKNKSGDMIRFLHKQKAETLEKYGAIDQMGKVNIDTGVCIFAPKILEKLYELICDEKGEFSQEKYEYFVNDKIRISLYGDFLYPLAKLSNLEDFYIQPAEVPMNEELKNARKIIFEKLHTYNAHVFTLHPAKFLHFGTTKEVFNLMKNDIGKYEYIDWKSQVKSLVKNKSISGYNSILSQKSQIGEGCYLESSYIHENAKIGKDCVLSYISIDNKTIPDDVVIHGLKLLNQKFIVKIYGINDNPKEEINSATLFGKNLKKFFEEKKIDINKEIFDINDPNEKTLWNAKMFCEGDTINEAMDYALNLFDLIVNDKGDLNKFINSNRKSFNNSFNESDCKALLDWDNKMKEIIIMENILLSIRNKENIVNVKQKIKFDNLTQHQVKWLENFAKKSNFYEIVHMYYFIYRIINKNSNEAQSYLNKCFDLIKEFLYKSNTGKYKNIEDLKVAKDKVEVEFPLRVNFGGAWSDTPPQCVDQGGVVLNAAIKLEGRNPVHVTVEKLKENKIILCSEDLNSSKEFTDLKELQDIGNPYDNLVLHKTALLACGVIPLIGGSLDDFFKKIGGGLKLEAKIINVPKGSGLGTSSILCAACAKGILEFFSIDYDNDKLFDIVLLMEQLMSTGGGWQDQIGGVIDGLKITTTEPGLPQKYQIEKIELKDEIKKKFNERFAIIYSGQRRLARNLLRDVIGNYLGNKPETIEALDKMKIIAVEMKKSLIEGDIDKFGELMNEHLKYSIMLDSGSINSLLNFIFKSIDDLIVGKMLIGAGGGGFLDVVLKEGVTKEQLNNRLKQNFQDYDVQVWDSELVL